MKRYHKNPRVITERAYALLEDSLDEFGDLGGIVHDLNSDEIIGGNQRSRIFDINKCKTEIYKRFEEPDEQGTIALGYVIWNGKRYNYRQVRWTEEKCAEANIKANKLGGDWDFDTLANEFDSDDLLDWGFEDDELMGVRLDEVMKETTMKLGQKTWVRILISVPLEFAGVVMETMQSLEKIEDIEIDYGSNERGTE